MDLRANGETPDQAWTKSGACAPGSGADPNLWFSDRPVDQARARALCWACPVAGPCLELGRRQPEGMFGGYTAEQRRAAGLELPELTPCSYCRQPLPPGWPTARHDECVAEAEAEARRQARAEASAARGCARCGAHLTPQARSCLVCRQIVGRALPNRPWPGK